MTRELLADDLKVGVRARVEQARLVGAGGWREGRAMLGPRGRVEHEPREESRCVHLPDAGRAVQDPRVVHAVARERRRERAHRRRLPEQRGARGAHFGTSISTQGCFVGAVPAGAPFGGGSSRSSPFTSMLGNCLKSRSTGGLKSVLRGS